MPALKDLIPAAFFVAPPPRRLAGHGKIDVCRLAPFQGQLLVSWGKGCPVFNENLAAARQLKVAGFGTYRPDHGGWCFAPHAVAEVFEAFPSLEVTPAVLALLDAPPPVSEIHGTIRWDAAAKQWAVAFGGAGMTVSRDAFARYLEAVKGIKNGVQGCRGYQPASKVWLLAKSAAARIVAAFPAEHFDPPADLLEAAKGEPAAVPVNRVVANIAAKDDAGPDAYAGRLLALAKTMLASL